MDLLALAVKIQLQYPPLKANVMVLFSIIAEEIGMIIPAPLTQVWNGNESFNASIPPTDERNLERVSRDEITVQLARISSPMFSIFFMTTIGVSYPEVDDLCSS